MRREGGFRSARLVILLPSSVRVLTLPIKLRHALLDAVAHPAVYGLAAAVENGVQDSQVSF